MQSSDDLHDEMQCSPPHSHADGIRASSIGPDDELSDEQPILTEEAAVILSRILRARLTDCSSGPVSAPGAA